ncbi:MAG: RNA 2',3'-cyclic phosphodiesterase [Methanobacteriaceae archaeon]|nr:RNA 2',3'-cyclic phosphodiesterase [Methanobacteriaceae archaeon]
MRTFLGIDLDENLVEKVVGLQKKLMETEAPLKLVEGENLHFTFKFFGEINQEKQDEIIKATKNKVSEFEPFDLSIKGMGVFPNLRYIRVLWLGVENPELFSKMLQGFDEEFVKMGFKKERSYIPHLTIGRLKGAQNKEDLVTKIEELNEVEIGNMKVDRLILKKSELTPSGPIYTDLKEFELTK